VSKLLLDPKLITWLFKFKLFTSFIEDKVEFEKLKTFKKLKFSRNTLKKLNTDNFSKKDTNVKLVNKLNNSKKFIDSAYI